MKPRYIKLDWQTDLSGISDDLIKYSVESKYSLNRNIKTESIMELVPELKLINSRLKRFNIELDSATVLIVGGGVFGGIHVDFEPDGRPLELKINIPIINGTSMFTRWYDLSGLEYSKITWEYRPREYRDGDRWLIQNREFLAENRCIDHLQLDTAYIIRPDEPHNVDGRGSTVQRQVLSTMWVNTVENRHVRWHERQYFIDCFSGS